VAALDAQVGEWFLARYGAGEVMRRVYGPGTGHAAQIAELEATRRRLRDDRNVGLYDSADDAEWFRTEYKRLGDEIAALKANALQGRDVDVVPAADDDRLALGDLGAARRVERDPVSRLLLHPRVALSHRGGARPCTGQLSTLGH
jgi:site-specific DNA recombinase